MESTSSHNSIKDALINGTIFTETCWTLAEDLGQERSTCNWVGQKREKEKENKKWNGTCAPGWGGAKGEVPMSGETPHWWEISRDRWEVQGPRGETNNQSVVSRTEWDLYRWCMPQSGMPQPERCVHWYGWGLGAGIWDLESKPGERTVSCKEPV